MMKSKKTTSFIILLILPLVGCGKPDSLVWSNPKKVPDGAIEKAFELRIEKHPGIAFHCLDIEGSNPPEPVMNALMDKHFKVFAGLDCKETDGQQFKYQSPDGQPANLYSLSRFNPNTEAEWEVSWIESLPDAKAKSGVSKLKAANGQWQANDLLDSRQAWGQ